MPTLKDIEQLATGHGVGIAVLLVLVPALFLALGYLYRENRALYGRIESLLIERGDALTKLLKERHDD